MDMYCLAILDSGNFVLSLCRSLEKKGYVFEMVSTPCKIAKDGCGYCLKFPEKFTGVVLEEGKLNNIRIREVYKIVPGLTKNTYERIY